MIVIMDLPEDVLCHLTTFLPWKTFLQYSYTCKLLYNWSILKSDILEKSVYTSNEDILKKYWSLFGKRKQKNLHILKNIYSRRLNEPYNHNTVYIKRLYNQYFFMNCMLNDEFKIWSPLFKTSDIEITDNKYIVSIGGNYYSKLLDTWKNILQTMTILMYRNIPHSASIRIVSCPYRQWDTTPPTPIAALDIVKIYANKYKDGLGKRKRSEAMKKHIPTKYWHSKTSFNQSFHALQCMNIKKGSTARVLTSFKIFRNPNSSWEWFLKCTFDKIDIYCY